MQTAQQPGACQAAPGQIFVEEARLAGLPVINTVLARLGLDAILAAALAENNIGYELLRVEWPVVQIFGGFQQT